MNFDFQGNNTVLNINVPDDHEQKLDYYENILRYEIQVYLDKL